ncbi:MAG: serine/threonine protein kinase [Gemmatimonadaceae bacterium]|nr:serine/threonine protein kinase [Gemmatimonadaceae bacterium]
MASDLVARLQSQLRDRFQLGVELVGGGMSRVFRATEVALGREVVIKVLPPELLSDASLRRFTREVLTTAQLQHPHILPLIAAGGDDAVAWYAAPFVEGESLRRRLADGAVFALDDAHTIIRELASAVAHAHRAGIVHRDIKPGNVLLSHGHAVLADFGVARALASEEDGAGPSLSVAGEERYVAPEGAGSVQADLFSLACVAEELLAGTRAAGAREDAVVRALRSRHPVLSSARAQAIAAVLRRASAPDPARRTASVEAFVAGLDGAMRSSRARRAAIAGAVFGGLVIAAAAWRTGSATSASAVMPPPAPITTAAAGPTATAADAPGLDPAAVRAALADSVDAEWEAARFTRALPYLDRLATLDAGDVRTAYRRAIVASWSRDSSTLESRRALLAAVEGRGGAALDAYERAVVEGAAALAERAYPAACAAFTRALAVREGFEALIGTGDCRESDAMVVRDANGARFRTSFAEAQQYYLRASRLGSGASPLPYLRLRNVSFTQTGRVRRGIGPDGAAWLGFPERIGDTVTFVAAQPGPRRIDDGSVERQAAAFALTRERLVPILAAWARRAPDEPTAHSFLAELLEETGRIREGGADGLTALGSIRRARALIRDGATDVTARKTHTRILLRLGEFAAAAALADSTLATHDSTLALSDGVLVMAALTGRVTRATEALADLGASYVRLLRGVDGTPIAVPASTKRALAGFSVRAALGVCDDDVRAAPVEFRRVLDAMMPPATRPPAVEQAFLERPIGLALDCLGLDAARTFARPTFPAMAAAKAFASGLPDDGLERFAALDQLRLRGGPVENFEWGMIEAHVRLARADTAGAIRALQRPLDALPTSSPSFFVGETNPALIGRSLGLIAELSAARGDRMNARRYATHAVALWRGADPVLQPRVARWRAIAGS